jgi:predicted thioesterase
MRPPVALVAKGNEVMLGIFARVAAKLLVVDLQAGHTTAGLTPPSVSLQHLTSQLGVGCRIKLQTSCLGPDGVHATCSAIASRKLCL